MSFVEAVTLAGRHATLEPLALEHEDEIKLAVTDGELWKLWFNKRSQTAIERLGAKRDGVMRNHMIMADGRIRDTVVYSIIENEWAGVKMNLQHKLKSRG